MSTAALTSRIPHGDPYKREVEEAVRAALQNEPHPFDVEITRSSTSRTRFFIVLKDTTSGVQRTVFVGGVRGQRSRRIQKRIRDVLS